MRAGPENRVAVVGCPPVYDRRQAGAVRKSTPARLSSTGARTMRAIDVLVAVAVAPIANPAELLAACADGGQPAEAPGAIDGVEV